MKITLYTNNSFTQEGRLKGVRLDQGEKYQSNSELQMMRNYITEVQRTLGILSSQNSSTPTKEPQTFNRSSHTIQSEGFQQKYDCDTLRIFERCHDVE